MNDSKVNHADVEQISQNLLAVDQEIAVAAQKSGRDANDVRLIAVSKAQPLERIQAAYSVGLRSFGENRLEEALPKIEALADLPDLEWHMVGHVQSRKAKLLGHNFTLLHSVDRLKLARKLNGLYIETGSRLSILIE
jgi:pyridoxal phosphate enzyme (YggS family)